MTRPGYPDHPDAPGVSVCNHHPICVLPRHVRSISHCDCTPGAPYGTAGGDPVEPYECELHQVRRALSGEEGLAAAPSEGTTGALSVGKEGP